MQTCQFLVKVLFPVVKITRLVELPVGDLLFPWELGNSLGKTVCKFKVLQLLGMFGANAGCISECSHHEIVLNVHLEN